MDNFSVIIKARIDTIRTDLARLTTLMNSNKKDIENRIAHMHESIIKYLSNQSTPHTKSPPKIKTLWLAEHIDYPGFYRTENSTISDFISEVETFPTRELCEDFCKKSSYSRAKFRPIPYVTTDGETTPAAPAADTDNNTPKGAAIQDDKTTENISVMFTAFYVDGSCSDKHIKANEDGSRRPFLHALTTNISDNPMKFISEIQCESFCYRWNRKAEDAGITERVTAVVTAYKEWQ